MFRRVFACSMVTTVWWSGCIHAPADPPDAFARDEGASSPWLAMVDDAARDAGVDASVGIPCAIETLLESNCQPCHDGSPLAPPWALSTLASFYAVSALDASRTVVEVAYERVGAEDARRMPPPMAGPLDESDRTLLLAWLRDGAPAGAACPAPEASEPPLLPPTPGIDAGVGAVSGE